MLLNADMAWPVHDQRLRARSLAGEKAFKKPQHPVWSGEFFTHGDAQRWATGSTQDLSI